jgi:glycosyltransferase involved in cell wall biosynthesis
MSLPKVLCVVNKQLPDNDYRINFRRHSRQVEIAFGLPGRPRCLAQHEYVSLGFSEGFGLRDITCFGALLLHLWKNRRNYALVHFFSTKLQLFGPLVAALAGVPSISTITGFGRTFNRNELRYRLLRPVYLGLARLSLNFSKAWYFQNRGDMQYLARRFPSLSSKMHWVGSGVDADAVNRKDFQQSPLIVLMVARLMPDKGVEIFLKVARRLSGGAFKFVLAGPPSVGQNALYRKVVQAHNEQLIEYVGELSTSELQDWYQRSHIFAFPSRGEGMPRVMLEAGYGLLCPVASDIPAHRDLIDVGRGFLLKTGCEAESLAGHLDRLNKDRTELKHNAQSYQLYIASNYSIDAYACRMDKYLDQLVNSSSTTEHDLRKVA